MAEQEAAINPKPIISLMFGVSVGFWANTLAKFVEKLGDTIEPKEIVILISGILFLLDLLCIVWWYARYIYRVQSSALFGAYFLDFVISSMFALAANSWTDPNPFLLATSFGSLFLVYRFWLLYRSPDTSVTDKRILMRAGAILGLALLVSFYGMGILNRQWPDLWLCGWGRGHGLPGVFSLIGVLLTLYLRTRIDVAVDLYAARQSAILPAYLEWPASELPSPDQKMPIRQQSIEGLKRFDAMFKSSRKHERIHSRVHTDTELRVQSYILAIPSCEREDCHQEIAEKAFMVALSHWLDDFVDGRNELLVHKRLLNGPPLSDNLDKAKELFEHIYRPIIIKYTDRSFYDNLHSTICNQSLFSYNLRYILLGLNRIAYGAVIFSPRIAEDERRGVLSTHNVFLTQWNNGERNALARKVDNILDRTAGGGEVGEILLGLTTKTVQEIAMSSEFPQLYPELSIAFSILYAPLIYYQNILLELKNGEMVSLHAFDTDYDLWIPWLAETREAIDRFGEYDDRHEARLQQIAMAYLCFKPMLPKHIVPRIEPIYLPKQTES